MCTRRCPEIMRALILCCNFFSRIDQLERNLEAENDAKLKVENLFQVSVKY